MEFVGSAKDLLITLMMKVAWAALLAALLARFATFRKILFAEPRDSDQKVKLLLMLTTPLAIGVLLRLASYRFADLTLEGSFLIGLMGGRVLGPLGGSIISLPAFINHEWLSTPMAAAAGLLGGLIRQVFPNKEDVWDFGPFLFLSVPRKLWRLVRHGKAAWELLPLIACVALEVGRQAMGRALPARWLFALEPRDPLLFTLVLFSAILAVSVPIKIWNTTRIEINLEQNQQLLLRARMDALSSQINPHFLFNTLNAVASLVRYDPDLARVVVIKLSNILRRLLRKHETFVPLREELDFIDDYLDIEVARFGRDKLQIFKEIDERTLEVFVPSMLLQPIIENAIKHGIGPKLEGGEIRLRARQQDGRLTIEVEDNGMGIPENRLPEVYADGIGISNVNERLRLLYGDDFRMDIQSRPGQGTCIRVEVPELAPALPASS
jgi:two-component system LytT family sensor kinase